MTTQSEIDTILSEFDVILVKLHGFREVIAIAPPDGLKALHEEWLKLYELGDDVSYLAVRLDLDYQRQFAEEEGRDQTPEYILNDDRYCPGCGLPHQDCICPDEPLFDGRDEHDDPVEFADL